MLLTALATVFAVSALSDADAFTAKFVPHCRNMAGSSSAILSVISGEEEFDNGRRELVGSTLSAALITGSLFGLRQQPALADDKRPDSLDIENFLRTGQEANPMGVSSQAGKSRPETGVFLRDGSEVVRDSKSGQVFAEIVLGSRSEPKAVGVSFSSPWQQAKGTVFDVECRDAKTGDGAFVLVTSNTGGKSVGALPTSFFVDQLFSPTGRFSFYGSPTNIKVKKSREEGGYQFMELSFSNLSQSTQTEIPRIALVSATIPEGTDQAVMLVGSATASRWRKGSEPLVRKTVESFRADVELNTRRKVRIKERGSSYF